MDRTADLSYKKIDELRALVGDTYQAWKKKRGGPAGNDASNPTRVHVERRRSSLPQSESITSQAGAMEFRAEAEGSATLRFKIPSLHADLFVHLDDGDADPPSEPEAAADREVVRANAGLVPHPPESAPPPAHRTAHPGAHAHFDAAAEPPPHAPLGGPSFFAGEGSPASRPESRSSRPQSRSYRSRQKKRNQSFKSILREIESKIAEAGFANTAHVDLTSGTPFSIDIIDERFFRLKKGTLTSPILIRLSSATGAAKAYADFHHKRPSPDHHRWFLGDVLPHQPVAFVIPSGEFAPVDQELHIAVYPAERGPFGGCSVTVEAVCERINPLKYLSGVGFQESVSTSRGPHYVTFEARSRKETQLLVVNLVSVAGSAAAAGAVAYIAPRDMPYPDERNHVWAMDSRTSPKAFISPEHPSFGKGMFSACIDYDGPESTLYGGAPPEVPFTFSATMQRRSSVAHGHSTVWRAGLPTAGSHTKGGAEGEDGERESDEDGADGSSPAHADAAPPERRGSIRESLSARRGSRDAAASRAEADVPLRRASQPEIASPRRSSLAEAASPRRASNAESSPRRPSVGEPTPRPPASPRPAGFASVSRPSPPLAPMAPPRSPRLHALDSPSPPFAGGAAGSSSPPRAAPGADRTPSPQPRRASKLPNLSALTLGPECGDLPIELSPRGSGAAAAAMLHPVPHSGSASGNSFRRLRKSSLAAPTDSPKIQVTPTTIQATVKPPADGFTPLDVWSTLGFPAAPSPQPHAPPLSPVPPPLPPPGPPPRRGRSAAGRRQSSPDATSSASPLPSPRGQPPPSPAAIDIQASTPVADLFLAAHAKELDRLESGDSVLDRTMCSFAPGEEGTKLVLARSAGVMTAAARAVELSSRKPTDPI